MKYHINGTKGIYFFLPFLIVVSFQQCSSDFRSASHNQEHPSLDVSSEEVEDLIGPELIGQLKSQGYSKFQIVSAQEGEELLLDDPSAFKVVSDPQASAGASLGFLPNRFGRSTMMVELGHEGDYVLLTRMSAPDQSTSALDFNINDQEETTIQTRSRPSESYQWDLVLFAESRKPSQSNYVSKSSLGILTLDRGLNSFTFSGRQGENRLDHVLLVRTYKDEESEKDKEKNPVQETNPPVKDEGILCQYRQSESQAFRDVSWTKVTDENHCKKICDYMIEVQNNPTQCQYKGKIIADSLKSKDQDVNDEEETTEQDTDQDDDNEDIDPKEDPSPIGSGNSLRCEYRHSPTGSYSEVSWVDINDEDQCKKICNTMISSQNKPTQCQYGGELIADSISDNIEDEDDSSVSLPQSGSGQCRFDKKPDLVISGKTFTGKGLSTIKAKTVLIENNTFKNGSCYAIPVDVPSVEKVIIRNNRVENWEPCVRDGAKRGAAFFIGFQASHSELKKEICIEGNTFKNLGTNLKSIETKTSNVIIKGNSGDGMLNIRHGRNVLLENNHMNNGYNIMGYGHTVRNNKGSVYLHAGNITQNDVTKSGGGSRYPFAERIRMDLSQSYQIKCWLSSCPYQPTDHQGKTIPRP